MSEQYDEQVQEQRCPTVIQSRARTDETKRRQASQNDCQYQKYHYDDLQTSHSCVPPGYVGCTQKGYHMNVFFITCLHRAEKRSRCWGWYQRFEDAEKVVLENQTDIFELGWFDTCVIEEYPEGVLSVPENRWWYSYRRDEMKADLVDRISEPNEFEQVICFAIG